LSAGDDVVGLGRKPECAQMLGDLSRTAGGVVGDEQCPGTNCCQGFDGTGSGFMATEDSAIEVEK
jgi:hypothetical protein